MQAIEQQLSLSAGLLDFSYAEFDSGNRLLDEENGNIPGLSVALSSKALSRRLLIRAQFYAGRVEYDGQTQDAVPFTTETDQQIYILNVQQFFSDAGDERLEWLIGVELWRWNRDILSQATVDGLFEKYSWQTLGAGFSMRLLQRAASKVWLECQLLQVLSPRMSIRLDNGFTGVSLGERPGYRLRFVYQQSLSRQWQWRAEAFVQHFEFAQSEPVLVNGFFGQSVVLREPRSVSRYQGLQIAMNYRFDL